MIDESRQVVATIPDYTTLPACAEVCPVARLRLCMLEPLHDGPHGTVLPGLHAPAEERIVIWWKNEQELGVQAEPELVESASG